jgi:hypothetical protein
MKYNGIRHVTSAPYHPRTNGLAERLIQTLKQSMRASKVEDTPLLKRLANFLLTYRTSPHSTTGETPAKLFVGRELCTRLMRLKPSIRDTVEAKQESMRYRTPETARQFIIGDKVAVRDYRSNCEKWIPGTIDSKTGPLSYRVEITPGKTWRRHTDQLGSAGFSRNRDPCDVHQPLPSQDNAPLVDNANYQQSTELVETPKTCVTNPAPECEKRYPTRSTRNVKPKRYQE